MALLTRGVSAMFCLVVLVQLIKIVNERKHGTKPALTDVWTRKEYVLERIRPSTVISIAYQKEFLLF